nr:amidase [uncultured Roseovarius sp.]
MPRNCFLDWSTEKLSDGIRFGHPSSVDVVSACLRRIENRDQELHAFVKVFAEAALQRATKLDAEITAGQWRGPLHGLPVAVKDLVDIEGEITGFGSRSFSDVAANRSAHFVMALEEAGAVVIGKTHTVEFAFGSWGTNSTLGTPVNPALPGHYAPGGSSSGSAVAVAAGMVPLAIGSDTGGSVRIPAALCGIAGLKTSQGIVSLKGVASLSESLDTVGPLAKDVVGLQILYDAMRSTREPSAHTIPTFRFHRISEEALLPADHQMVTLYDNYISRLGARNSKVEELELPLPLTEYQSRCGNIMAYEAYHTHRKIIDDYRLPLDPWVRRRISLGRKISQNEYQGALQQRRDDIVSFLEIFGDADVLVLPTTPIPAQPVETIDEAGIPMSRYTRLANYLDLTAVSIPLGEVGGAPVGVQFAMRKGQDDSLLRLMKATYLDI